MKAFITSLILVICVVTSCVTVKSDTDIVPEVAETEKYTAKQWVDSNKIKLTYDDNKNLQLIFRVKVDSTARKYILYPDIKIARATILANTTAFAKENNVDVNKFIIQLSIRFIAGNIYKLTTPLSQILSMSQDTLYFFKALLHGS